ncbi:MAG TPA: hypothetical protein VNU66_13225 [Mycobacteriales bacterium]|nr:hypothetical protein [Mycobacteriales bacterium]
MLVSRRVPSRRLLVVLLSAVALVVAVAASLVSAGGPVAQHAGQHVEVTVTPLVPPGAAFRGRDDADGAPTDVATELAGTAADAALLAGAGIGGDVAPDAALPAGPVAASPASSSSGAADGRDDVGGAAVTPAAPRGPPAAQR